MPQRAQSEVDQEWRRFRETGAPDAFAAVFDALSPELFRIAVGLSPSASSAEDALQETFLTALQSRDAHDGTRPIAPWLVGILRLKVHEVRRAGRRPSPDRIRTPPPVADPAERAESRDDVAQLHAALDALPERYREVAVLRWRYGLEPAEIADARGLAPGTVRSLLHRALDKLRKRVTVLPAVIFAGGAPRGLESVRAELVRVAAVAHTTGAALTGGSLMATTTKATPIALLALVGMLAVATVLWAVGDPRAEVPIERTSRSSEPVRERRSDRRAPEDEAVAESSTAVPTRSVFLRGRVIDEDGLPVQGARVVVRGHEHVAGDTVEGAVAATDEAAAIADESGAFEVVDKPTDLASLMVLAHGYHPSELRRFDDAPTVVLQRCEPFTGRVVDTAGRGVAGASIRIQGPFEKQPPFRRSLLVAQTDGQGQFAFGSVPEDAFVCGLDAAGYRLPELRHRLAVALREEYVVERSRMFIDVTDAATGEPVDGARGVVIREDGVALGALSTGGAWMPPRPESGRPPGRLFWNPLRDPPDMPFTVHVLAEGYGPARRVANWEATREPPRLAVVLERGRGDGGLSGRVIDGAGSLVRARLTSTLPDGRRMVMADHRLPIVAEVRADGSGAFALHGLPGGSYVLTAEGDSGVMATRRIDAPATGVELQMPAVAHLVVALADRAGVPRSGEWVHVQSTDDRRHWDVPTGDDGRAVFEALPAVEVDVLIIHNEGILPGGLRTCSPVPGVRHQLEAGDNVVEVEWPERRTLEVSVRNDQGAPLSDASVTVEIRGGMIAFRRDERAQLAHEERRTDAEGRVTLELLPCRGVVRTYVAGRRVTGKFEIAGDVGAEVELVVPTITGSVSGRIFDPGTHDAIAERPIKAFAGGQLIASVFTDSEGRFALSAIPAGEVRISVDGRASADRRVDPTSPYPYATTTLRLAAGEDRTLDIALPRVSGTDALARTETVRCSARTVDGDPIEGAFVLVSAEIDGVLVRLGTAQTDQAGWAECSVAEAANYAVEAFRGTERTSRVVAVAEASEVELVLKPDQ